MAEYEHKTERGALLAALEHRCLRPGLWEVEGYEVEKLGTGSWRSPIRWTVSRKGGAALHTGDDFTAALRFIDGLTR